MSSLEFSSCELSVFDSKVYDKYVNFCQEISDRTGRWSDDGQQKGLPFDIGLRIGLILRALCAFDFCTVDAITCDF